MAKRIGNKNRQMVDVGELVEEIDQYPQAAGIDADVWATLTYTQKVKLLIQRQLESVQEKIDNLGKTDE